MAALAPRLSAYGGGYFESYLPRIGHFVLEAVSPPLLQHAPSATSAVGGELCALPPAALLRAPAGKPATDPWSSASGSAVLRAPSSLWSRAPSSLWSRADPASSAWVNKGLGIGASTAIVFFAANGAVKTQEIADSAVAPPLPNPDDGDDEDDEEPDDNDTEARRLEKLVKELHKKVDKLIPAAQGMSLGQKLVITFFNKRIGGVILKIGQFLEDSYELLGKLLLLGGAVTGVIVLNLSPLDAWRMFVKWLRNLRREKLISLRELRDQPTLSKSVCPVCGSQFTCTECGSNTVCPSCPRTPTPPVPLKCNCGLEAVCNKCGAPSYCEKCSPIAETPIAETSAWELLYLEFPGYP